MDNFHVDITSEGDDHLNKALTLIFGTHKAVGYMVHPEKGMVFFWLDKQEGITAFPFKMDAAGATEFVKRWLAEVPYGPQPDHDGSNGKGFRVYNDSWGRVDGYTYSFAAVKPNWAWYGK